MIWTDALLNQLAHDAAYDAHNKVTCLFHRYHLATTANVPIYTLPNTSGIKRITYRGIKVDPLSWIEMEALAPFAAWVSSGTNNDPSIGVPRWYALHPTDVHAIRLYPTPMDSYTDTGDPYSPVAAEPKCTVTCWRDFDPDDDTTNLPDYVDRRLRKAYVLWQAFKKEGKGQDTNAAAFYSSKYQFLIELFKKINSGVFISKRYCLGSSAPRVNSGRPAKPQLPATFERTFYR